MRSALMGLVSLAVACTACSSAEQAVRDISVTASVPVPTPTAATPVPTAAATLTVAPGATVSVEPEPEPSATAVPTSTTSAPVASRTSTATPAPTTSAPTTSAPSEEPADPLASRSPLETAPPTGQPTCAASTLTVTDAGRAYTLSAVQTLFTLRTSGRDCQLEGYPTVALRDAAGRALSATVRRGGYGLPAERPAAVTLSRGTSVSFYVATAREQGCAAAATLVVTLPGTKQPLTAATTAEVCDEQVGITPVRRETDDE